MVTPACRTAVVAAAVVAASVGVASAAVAASIQKLLLTGDQVAGDAQPIGAIGFVYRFDDAIAFDASFTPRLFTLPVGYTSGMTPITAFDRFYPYRGSDGLWVRPHGGSMRNLVLNATLLDDGSSSGSSGDYRLPFVRTRNLFDSSGATYATLPDRDVARIAPDGSVSRAYLRYGVFPNGSSPPFGEFPDYRLAFDGMFGDEPVLALSLIDKVSGTLSFDFQTYVGNPFDGRAPYLESGVPFLPSTSSLPARTVTLRSFNGGGFGIGSLELDPPFPNSVLKRSGIFVYDTTLTPLRHLEEEALVPGLGLVRDLGGATADAAGRMLFAAVVEDPTSGALTDGLWREDGTGGFERLFAVGDPAPGLGGVVYAPSGASILGLHPTYANAKTFVEGWVRQDTVVLGDALWAVQDDGAIDLVLAPGSTTTDGRRLSTLIGYHVIGESDEILAVAPLFDSSSSSPSRESIVLVDRGVVTALATAGRTFEVAVGDVRIVSEVELIGALGTNEGAFRLQFSDGTEGIFLVLVPEPGTGVLVALGTVVLAVRRRLRASFRVAANVRH